MIPAVTYTFVNGTVADATEVNRNFQDLIDALNNAAYDLNINNLTAGGLEISSTGLALSSSASSLSVGTASVDTLSARTTAISVSDPMTFTKAITVESSIIDKNLQPTAGTKALLFVNGTDGGYYNLPETNYLEPVELTLSMSGSTAAVDFCGTLSRMGDMVTFAWHGTATSTAALNYFHVGTLPEEVWPDLTLQSVGTASVYDGGSVKHAAISITAVGLIGFYAIDTSGAYAKEDIVGWSTSGTRYVMSGSVTWGIHQPIS